jgi:hypothetical protein
MSEYPGFPLGGSAPHAMLRFHLPLVELYVQISRIRLSDGIPKGSPRVGTKPDPSLLS